jgi:hypothetical protein
VQEVEPLAESLCFVLALDAETQPRVQRPKSTFETASRFVGIEEPAARQVIGLPGVHRQKCRSYEPQANEPAPDVVFLIRICWPHGAIQLSY